jgi:hypothetical protein
MMIIKSLEQMEQIVKKNKSLIWDGWTVVSLQPTNNGVMSKDGVKINNRWYLQKRYDANVDGWNIPDNLVG